MTKIRKISSLIPYGELLFSLIGRDLTIRYRGSILGFLWTILNPLFMALIYIVFLRIIGGRAIASQYENILIGVFAWQFTMQCINSGMTAITGNVVLVKKVSFPRIILPLSTSLANMVNFYLTLLVQVVLLIILLAFKSQTLPFLALLVPLVTIYHLAFNFSLTLFVASANVFFRDTQYVINLVVSAWFFLSPVMYPITLIKQIAHSSPVLGELYFINPMTIIISLYRYLQVPGESFYFGYGALIGLLIPFILLGAAILFFNKTEKYFSDIL
jgi:ABC-type polysaccharide/polyol phosphate export permease